jgi:hypothetical protein
MMKHTLHMPITHQTKRHMYLFFHTNLCTYAWVICPSTDQYCVKLFALFHFCSWYIATVDYAL